MTRAQADALLAEKGLILVDVYHQDDLSTPHHWLVAYASGGIVATGPTWRWALANALDIAPF